MIDEQWANFQRVITMITQNVTIEMYSVLSLKEFLFIARILFIKEL